MRFDTLTPFFEKCLSDQVFRGGVKKKEREIIREKYNRNLSIVEEIRRKEILKDLKYNSNIFQTENNMFMNQLLKSDIAL